MFTIHIGIIDKMRKIWTDWMVIGYSW